MLKTFLYSAALCACTLAATSCGSKQSTAEPTTVPTDSIVIVYYSQTGNTRLVADAIKEHLGEIATYEIVPVEPYDADYEATVERWKTERDSGIVVAIEPLDIEWDNYSTVFLGFPIWGGTYASPVATFLKENDLAGKKIVTFATFGSGGLDNATLDVATAQPQAEVFEGYGVRASRVGSAFDELDRFLIGNNYKEGILEPLGDYSEPTICNEEAIEAFNAACADYRYPLGTPVTVAQRETPWGTDFRFEVESVKPDGTKSASTIYVIKGKEEGAKPEFTKVVRH